MRLEATVPESRGIAVARLADELGLTRSQLIDEALTLFLKAVLEMKRGRRLVTMDPRTSQLACELATPTLSALEWAQGPQPLTLPTETVARMRELTQASPKAGSRLRAAAKRHRR